MVEWHGARHGDVRARGNLGLEIGSVPVSTIQLQILTTERLTFCSKKQVQEKKELQISYPTSPSSPQSHPCHEKSKAQHGLLMNRRTSLYRLSHATGTMHQAQARGLSGGRGRRLVVSLSGHRVGTGRPMWADVC